jgi:hypothetical protein
MNPKRARAGMKVYIKTSYKTKQRHGINSNMLAMVGKTYTIKEVRETHKVPHRVAIYIRGTEKRGFTWAPEDLEIPNSKIIRGGKFDPNNLIF